MDTAPRTAPPPDDERQCVMCGSDRLTWRKCKLVCQQCGTILKSCADL